MGTYLIAPWGHPKFFREVDYKFKDKKVTSKTSLKIIQDVVCPDTTIILGLDTLAEDGETYNDILKQVEETIREHAIEAGLLNPEILVAPGIGFFPKGRFYGQASDFYDYILWKLVEIFLADKDGVTEIHLDLTHGINFATILTYKALRQLSSVLSIFNRQLKFKAYNADPTGVRMSAERININIIEDSVPHPMPATILLDNRNPIKFEDIDKDELRDIFQNRLGITGVIYKGVSAFIGSFYNALPLAMFLFYPHVKELREVIGTTLQIYKTYIDIQKEEDVLTLRRYGRFSSGFEGYVMALFEAELLSKYNYIHERKEDVGIDEIKRLSDGLFGYDKRLSNKISKELYDLSEKIGQNATPLWEPYQIVWHRANHYSPPDSMKDPFNIPGPDERNFHAHSGFERNVVEVRSSPEGLRLRYRRDKNDRNTIRKFCRTGLSKTG